MQSWLEGRIWVGKGAQATGMTASLRIQSRKADSNTWESFTRSGLKLESVHQESLRSDVFRKRATKPLLNQRPRQKHLTWAVEKNNWTVAQWSKVLFSDESKFCISFGNQGPRVWRKSGGTESMLLEVQCEVSQFELNYWNKWTFPWHSNLLRCTCMGDGRRHVCSRWIRAVGLTTPKFIFSSRNTLK